MTEVDTPIDVGALYRKTDVNESGQFTFVRVVRIWVDEDLQTVLKCEFGNFGVVSDTSNISLDEFTDRIKSEEIVRHNTDHDAWEWRQ